MSTNVQGQVGGWKELMSGEQEALFDQKYKEQLGALGVRLNA